MRLSAIYDQSLLVTTDDQANTLMNFALGAFQEGQLKHFKALNLESSFSADGVGFKFDLCRELSTKYLAQVQIELYLGTLNVAQSMFVTNDNHGLMSSDYDTAKCFNGWELVEVWRPEREMEVESIVESAFNKLCEFHAELLTQLGVSAADAADLAKKVL